MKKAVAFVLAAATTITASTLSCATDHPYYKDVSSGDWYYQAVEAVTDDGLMSGVGNHIFDPSGFVTRAQFVQTLYKKAAGRNSEHQVERKFVDVRSSAWYYDAVMWAAKNGIVAGYDNGNFLPDEYVTREQMATILYHFDQEIFQPYLEELIPKDDNLSESEENVPEDDANDFNEPSVTDREKELDRFADKASVSPYAVEGLSWATRNSILNGVSEEVLAPKATATRAELAQILFSYNQYWNWSIIANVK